VWDVLGALGNEKLAYFGWKILSRRLLRKLDHRWENHIKISLKKWGGRVDWDFVKTVINLQVL
jgi:hypothetical protein